MSDHMAALAQTWSEQQSDVACCWEISPEASAILAEAAETAICSVELMSVTVYNAGPSSSPYRVDLVVL